MKTTLFAVIVALSTFAAPAFAREATKGGVADPASQSQMLLASAPAAAADQTVQLHTSPARSALT